jgi:predicted DNA-binding protein YlxM (UPF0122 family)
MRLSQPADVDKTAAARELLAIHAQRRLEVRLHDGYLTKLFYDHGIPVEDIAAAYGVGQRTVYDIIKRQPVGCHKPGETCTACGTVEVAF